MKKKPKRTLINFASNIAEGILIIAAVSAMGVGISALGLGVVYLYDFSAQTYHEYTESHALPTAAEIIDTAMAIPGAIVLSPHTDMRVTLGIPEYYSPIPGWNVYNAFVRTAGPAIAVHSKRYWCVWSLTNHTGFDGNGNEMPSNFIQNGEYVMFDSKLGYQKAFDNFKKCVAHGNANTTHD